MQIILLDRSIFHGTKFEQLRTSPLASMVRHSAVKVFCTPMFIEETLVYGLHNKPQFDAHWAFITSLIGQKWFKFAREISAIELSDNILGNNWYLQPRERVRRTMKNAEELASRRIPAKDLQKALSDIEQNKDIDIRFRQARLQMRSTTRLTWNDFDAFCESKAEWVIEKRLMPHIPGSSRFLTTWRSKRESCKFTEQLIKATLATIFLPIVDHELKVDKNDGTDSQQLAYLLWADILVSDDTRFMKKGFDLLYGTSAKRFMTLPEFLQHLEHCNCV